MGLSRRRFLSGATLLGAAAATGCATTVRGEARPNPADLRRISESASRVPDEVNMVVIAYQPYTIEDGGDLSGPVPDIARKVLTEIGVSEVNFEVVREQEKVLTMAAAGVLEIAGGLAVRPDLCGTIQFSMPDHVSGTALAVAAGNPMGLETFADVVGKGATVGVMLGIPEEQDAVRAGVPDDRIRRLPDPITLIEAVKSGQVDCFAFDELSLRSLVKEYGAGVEVADPFMPDGRLPLVGAYAFPQSSELFEPFNDALRQLHDSGEWQRMVEPFGLTENNAPPADLTTEKACAG